MEIVIKKRVGKENAFNFSPDEIKCIKDWLKNGANINDIVSKEKSLMTYVLSYFDFLKTERINIAYINIFHDIVNSDNIVIIEVNE